MEQQRVASASLPRMRGNGVSPFPVSLQTLRLQPELQLLQPVGGPPKPCLIPLLQLPTSPSASRHRGFSKLIAEWHLAACSKLRWQQLLMTLSSPRCTQFLHLQSGAGVAR
jgi:hypothetical protein